MASTYTYTTLKAALLAFTEETSTDSYATDIDKIIPLAEDTLLRDLDLELFDTLTTTVFGAATATLTKPTSLVVARTLHYTTAAGLFVLMEPRSWEVCKDYWPKESVTTATPKYYADYSPTQWYIAGTPASALTVTVRGVVRPAGLTSVVTTTWLSTTVGDLLLYACLVGSEQYLKADERVGLWKAEYAERLQAARVELMAQTRKDYLPLAPAPKV